MSASSKSVIAAVAVAASFSFAFTAKAQNADAEFFRGKTITYVVATAGGGGYDTYGRLLARYLEKYIPGARIIVRNVPGAGNIVGANTIYRARPDGLTFGIFNTGLVYSQMLKLDGVAFDLGRMSWIGKLASEGRTLVLSKRSGLTRVEDLITAREPIRLASSGVGAASHIETRMLEEMLNLNVRLITNLEGGETQLGMLRGDVAGVLEAASSHTDFVQRGDGRYVLSIAGGRSGVPGVPQARDYVKNPDHLRLLTLVETLAELGRPTAGPPGIPAGRLAYLRDAYMKAANDPQLRADAMQLEVPIDPLHGAEVQKKIGAILNQPPAIVTLLKTAAQAR